MNPPTVQAKREIHESRSLVRCIYEGTLSLCVRGQDFFLPDKVTIDAKLIAARQKGTKTLISYRDVDSDEVGTFCVQDALVNLTKSVNKLNLYVRHFSTMARHIKRKDKGYTEIAAYGVKEKKTKEMQYRFFTELLDNYTAYGPSVLVKFFEHGKEFKKKNFDGNLRQAAGRIKTKYGADQTSKKPRFKDLKDASNSFFQRHNFTKYPHITEGKLYENVKKA